MNAILRASTVLTLLLVACASAHAEEFSADEQTKLDAAVKGLEADDAGVRAASETEIRRMGAKVLPALAKAKVANADGLVRLRTVLMDMAVESAKMDSTDASFIMQISREEALAKRYGNAAKGYRRAEKLYEKLKDDADDRKDRPKKAEYTTLEEKADRFKDKADALAKGDEHKVGHWGPLPTLKKVEDDGDW